MSSDRSTPNAWPDREDMVRVIAEQKGVITNIARAVTAGAAKKSAPVGGKMFKHLSSVVGYDIEETAAVEKDRDLHKRVIARLRTDGELVAAEDVVGDLDAE